MIGVRPTLGLCCVLGAASAGCGLSRLQTARTVPRGQTQTTIAASVLHTSDRGFLPLAPLDLMVRHGATDRVDWGVRLFFGAGALGDVKWNLLAPERRTAVSLSAGLGAAYTGSGAGESSATSQPSGGTVHAPVTISASHAVLPWFTPYAAVGYGAFWIIGYGTRDPAQSYAPRSGTGDGLLTLHAGVELARASGRALLLEYTYARPVVSDPGDSFEFAVNQFISVAFHTGRGSAFER
ncbi:MAG TPA: hypothetical protein VFH68_03865 [Polyangia bacterium]|nr:hypothetical protein [Polyangia bacterium]